MTTSSTTHEITELLHAWSKGDQKAIDRLVPLVHAELHRRAKRYMAREQLGHILQPTALVNEVYVRLFNTEKVQWKDRAHFFNAAAQAMRHILVDIARKRGRKQFEVPLDDATDIPSDSGEDLVALDEALDHLSKLAPQQAQVIELRFFGGLSIKETAEVLMVSPGTVKNYSEAAKLWLLKELS